VFINLSRNSNEPHVSLRKHVIELVPLSKASSWLLLALVLTNKTCLKIFCLLCKANAYNLKLCTLSLNTLLFAATGAKNILFQILVTFYILRLVHWRNVVFCLYHFSGFL
jgi:hypothetical protein